MVPVVNTDSTEQVSTITPTEALTSDQITYTFPTDLDTSLPLTTESTATGSDTTTAFSSPTGETTASGASVRSALFDTTATGTSNTETITSNKATITGGSTNPSSAPTATGIVTQSTNSNGQVTSQESEVTSQASPTQSGDATTTSEQLIIAPVTTSVSRPKPTDDGVVISCNLWFFGSCIGGIFGWKLIHPPKIHPP